MTVLEALVEPAFHTAPAYDFTLGPVVIEFCASVGYIPDPEQELGLNDIFAEGDDGLPVMSSYACIGPRRNIKTGLEIQTAMGWLYVLEVPDVWYSAHKWKTAESTFNTFSEIIRNSDDLSRQMLPSRRGTGYAQLRWRTGETMTFTTRTLDGGRGDETDKHIIDEALKVRSQHIGALLPTLATRPLAQVLYGSSACQASSEVLHEIKDRGRAGADPTLGYLEYCAPQAWEEIEPGELVCDLGKECSHRRGVEGCGMDKPKVVARANSQFDRRIPPRFFVSMRAELPAAEFGREFLGWHDERAGAGVEPPPVKVDRWVAATDDDPENAPAKMPAFGLEVDGDQSIAVIDAAGERDDGRTHLEFIVKLPVRQAVRRCVELEEEHGPGCVFAVDGGGPAGDLIEDLEDAGLSVLTLGTKDMARACADLTNAINDPPVDELALLPIAHGPQQELLTAVEVARKRTVGGGGAFVFDRDVDALALLAAAEAKWALEHSAGEVSVFSFKALDMCDQCGKNAHEDPDGEHGYLCGDCRPTEDDWGSE